jgi:hypothetical protein
MSAVTELTLLPPDRETALALGSTHFFTGKPCSRGHISKRNTKSHTCMECARISAAKYQHTDKAQTMRRALIDKKKTAGIWKRNVAHRTLKHTYGITLEEYEAMFAKQDGLCAICAEAEKAIDHLTGEPRRLAVDHCHRTNKIRGLLCLACNTAIGKLKDNPVLIERAASYVRNEGELKCPLV